MDTIKIIAPDTGEEIEFYVLEETALNEVKYLLVAEDEEGDSEAYILKEVSSDEDEATYEFVEDDTEFESVTKIFMELVEDTDFLY